MEASVLVGGGANHRDLEDVVGPQLGHLRERAPRPDRSGEDRAATGVA
jgi:hypothetical protein